MLLFLIWINGMNISGARRWIQDFFCVAPETEMSAKRPHIPHSPTTTLPRHIIFRGKAPLFFYTRNIYRTLSNLTHLNNEPDITMSYLYREVPAWLFYFWRSVNLRTLYNLYMYICPCYLFLIFACLNFILIICFS